MFFKKGLELGCMEDVLESSDLRDTVAGTHRERGKEWGAKSILPCSCAWSEATIAAAPKGLSAPLRAPSEPSFSQGRTGHMFLARFSSFNLLEELKALPHIRKDSVLQLGAQLGLSRSTIDTYISRFLRRRQLLPLKKGL